MGPPESDTYKGLTGLAAYTEWRAETRGKTRKRVLPEGAKEKTPARGIGPAIRKLRGGLGLTQHQVVMRIEERGEHMDQATLSRTENKRPDADIGCKQLCLLAEALEVSPVEILHRAGIIEELTDEDFAHVVAHNPNLRELFSLSGRGSEKEQRRLFEFVTAAIEVV